MKPLAVTAALFALLTVGCAQNSDQIKSDQWPPLPSPESQMAELERGPDSAAEDEPDPGADQATEADTEAQKDQSAEASTEPAETQDKNAAAEEGQAGKAESDEAFFEAFQDEFTADDGAASVDVPDPLKGYNQAIFVFNDRLYFWVLKPAAEGYKTVMPYSFRYIFRNFFNNLQMPRRFMACLLQAKFQDAGEELLGFVINSTNGLFGFFNPAGLIFEGVPHDEDFGQVFGAWGIPHGFYFVIPILGPSSGRDFVGFLVDRTLSPLAYVDFPFLVSLSITTYDYFNTMSFRLGAYEQLVDVAVDPYEAVRDAYFQNRAKKQAE
jgi:phospholipid-binding lipoprotein MlaA